MLMEIIKHFRKIKQIFELTSQRGSKVVSGESSPRFAGLLQCDCFSNSIIQPFYPTSLTLQVRFQENYHLPYDLYSDERTVDSTLWSTIATNTCHSKNGNAIMASLLNVHSKSGMAMVWNRFTLVTNSGEQATEHTGESVSGDLCTLGNEWRFVNGFSHRYRPFDWNVQDTYQKFAFGAGEYSSGEYSSGTLDRSEKWPRWRAHILHRRFFSVYEALFGIFIPSLKVCPLRYEVHWGPNVWRPKFGFQVMNFRLQMPSSE